MTDPRGSPKRPPRIDDWNRPLTLTLTAGQWSMLRRAAHQLARKRERESAKSDFVPAPGKLDANLAEAASLRSAIEKIREIIE